MERQKWEYYLAPTHDTKELPDILRLLGQQGWELIETIIEEHDIGNECIRKSFLSILKRPVSLKKSNDPVG